MSPSFRPRLLVSLAPASVALARIEGALKPRLTGKWLRACDPQSGAESWQGAAAALADMLTELKDTACDASIVLSNHFVRYTLVPASDDLSGEDEELAFARYCFARIYGDRSKSWDVRMSDAAAGSPRLASAIDSGLLQAIRAGFPAGGKPRLASVQPYLMAAFNRCRQLAGKDAGWLLLLEPDRACVACFDHARWASVRSTRGEFASPSQWAELLDRERHLAGAREPGADVLVHAVPAGGMEPAESGAWRFRHVACPPLAGFSPFEDAGLAMALAAH